MVDTGVGITSEHLPRLFEPYFRSANKLTGQDSGSGLGLSICSRLAQLMEGRLWAISEHNLGTRFTFEVTLPLAEDSNMPPVPQLLPEPVYVDGAVPEIVNNLCDWLRHWGAQALPFAMSRSATTREEYWFKPGRHQSIRPTGTGNGSSRYRLP
ncbi:hypothetical protein DMB90_10860 [Raoultella planticola]|uniref:histidine kinase n=1 Tax=Raoultella planticola TaxID=575 RepID=A0A5P6A9T8_RAOPL|nr:hypothetical protein DMB90_10860 [Raoultella planticola]